MGFNSGFKGLTRNVGTNLPKYTAWHPTRQIFIIIMIITSSLTYFEIFEVIYLFQDRNMLHRTLVTTLSAPTKATMKSPSSRAPMEQYIPTTGNASSILRDCASSGVILILSSNQNMGKNMVGTPEYKLEWNKIHLNILTYRNWEHVYQNSLIGDLTSLCIL